MEELINEIVEGRLTERKALVRLREAWSRCSEPGWLLRAHALTGDVEGVVEAAFLCARSIVEWVPADLTVVLRTTGALRARREAEAALAPAESGSDLEVLSHAVGLLGVLSEKVSMMDLGDGGAASRALHAAADAVHASLLARLPNDDPEALHYEGVNLTPAEMARTAARASDAVKFHGAEAARIVEVIRSRLGVPDRLDRTMLASERAYHAWSAHVARTISDLERKWSRGSPGEGHLDSE